MSLSNYLGRSVLEHNSVASGKFVFSMNILFTDLCVYMLLMIGSQITSPLVDHGHADCYALKHENINPMHYYFDYWDLVQIYRNMYTQSQNLLFLFDSS